MTKGALFEKLETGFIVLVITGLIWLYADNETVDDYTATATVRFVSDTGAELAIAPDKETIAITYQASKAQKDKVDQITANPIEIKVEPKPGNGYPMQIINLADRLNDTVFDEIGVTIDTTSSPTLDISVQPIERKEMPVQVDSENVPLAEWEATPDVATVTLPADLAEKLTPDQTVIARLDTNTSDELEVGVPQSRTVQLYLPEELEGPWSRITPPTARITFTILKKTSTTTVRSVPILILASDVLLLKYDIELHRAQRVLSDVVLEGPSDVIDRIENNEVRIIAWIRPTSEELESGAESLPVHILTPDSVEVSSPPFSVPVTVTATE